MAYRQWLVRTATYVLCNIKTAKLQSTYTNNLYMAVSLLYTQCHKTSVHAGSPALYHECSVHHSRVGSPLSRMCQVIGVKRCNSQFSGGGQTAPQNFPDSSTRDATVL